MELKRVKAMGTENGEAKGTEKGESDGEYINYNELKKMKYK